MNPIKYKNYVATIEIDYEEGIVIGRVHGLKDKISFHTNDIKKIKDEFHAAVDDYLTFCEELGEEPEKPFNGSILIRTTPEIHRRVAMAAIESGEKQGKWIEKVIVHYLDKNKKCQTCQAETAKHLTHFIQEINLLGKQPSINVAEWGTSSADMHSLGIYKND